MPEGKLDEYQQKLDAAVTRYRAGIGAVAKAESAIPEPQRKGEAVDVSGAIEATRELDEARIALRHALTDGPYPAKTAAELAGLSRDEFLDVTRY
jgi:hypothetical protein